MSQQYQQFKQTFFKQHPPQPSHQQMPNLYDRHNEYQTTEQRFIRNQSDDNLRIEQESHYPFEEIQHGGAFDRQEDDVFADDRRRRQYQQQEHHHQQKYSNANNRTSEFTHDKDDYASYEVNNEFPERQYANTTTTTTTKQYNQTQQQQNNLQQQSIASINYELEKLRSNSKYEEKEYLHPGYVGRQQAKMMQVETTVRPPQIQQQQYEPRYVESARGSNINTNINNNINTNQNANQNNVFVSPAKHLPVIYSKPNVLTNSTSKVSSPQSISTVSASNSRVVIQPPMQHSVYVASQIHGQPLANMPPPMHYVQGPMINGTSSNSRLLIQSETINKPLLNQQIVQFHHGNMPGQFVQTSIKPSTQPMIPLKQYERLRSECSMWQQKYYETSEHLIKFQSQNNPYLPQNSQYLASNTQQMLLLRQQNHKLLQKVRCSQTADKFTHDKLKQAYEELIKKYQESLTKESELLVDRFRLEMKHNERY